MASSALVRVESNRIESALPNTSATEVTVLKKSVWKLGG